MTNVSFCSEYLDYQRCLFHQLALHIFRDVLREMNLEDNVLYNVLILMNKNLITTVFLCMSSWRFVKGCD